MRFDSMEATARAKSARVLSAALAGFDLIALGAAWHLETPQFVAPMVVGAAGYGVCHFLVRKGWFVVGMLGAVTLLLGQQVALGSTGFALAATPCWGPLIVVIAAASLPLYWLSTALGLTLATHGVLASFDNNLARTWPEYALGAALSATAFGIAWYRAKDTSQISSDARRSSARSPLPSPSESDEQRRLIADHVDDLIALLDAQAKPVFLSPSHARVFGQPLEELMLASVDQWVIPEHREEFRGAIADAFKTGRSNLEVSLCGPNGITRIFDMKLKRVEGATHSWLASASRDVTERKGLQQRLMSNERMESLARLAGSVAHDFNNLLMVIGGAGEMARHAAKGIPAAVEDLDNVLEATHKASKLTRQLLTFSRKQVVTVTTLDLALSLFEIHDLIERLVGNKIKLVFDFEPGCPKVVMAAAHLEQLAMDLALNARDAMPNGGELTFGLRSIRLDADEPPLTAGVYVEFFVRDVGTGIPEDVQQHIFEPLFTTKGELGTGLGLPTCQNIVSACHGTISVESALGHGTTFRIRLPTCQNSSARPPQRPSPLPEPIRRVLVVDDEPMPRETSARMLRASGFEVVVASNLAEARQYINDPSVELDALLTDVVLSGETGIDLLEECRQHRPKMRIVVMSGYSPNPEASRKVMAVSAKFLPKPFNRQELLRALGTVEATL